MKTKISVALCTYNGEKFLEKQLNSILSQTIPVDEIIVCDDKSSDQTKAILEKHKASHPDIFKIYYNKKNLRSNKNFEKAIKLTTGDYIFLSDQDDLWLKTKVEKTLRVFNENPKAEGVFSDATLIDDKDVDLFENSSLWQSVSFFEKLIPKPIDLYSLLILKGNYLTGATLCIKKSVKDFCFPFKTLDKIFLHDEWFAFILAQRSTLFYSTEKLMAYRIHSDQQMGVGDIESNILNPKKIPRAVGIFLGTYSPKSFKDFKILTRTLFAQYEKYISLILDNQFADEKVEEKLLNFYKQADADMKENYPVLYNLRKRKDKKKGRRQI